MSHTNDTLNAEILDGLRRAEKLVKAASASELAVKKVIVQDDEPQLVYRRDDEPAPPRHARRR